MKKHDFEKLLESVKQAGAIKAGKLTPRRVFNHNASSIREIRSEMNVSQSQFAEMIGVSISTIQNWEQGRRKPVGPAKALLTVAKRNPLAILEALRS